MASEITVASGHFVSVLITSTVNSFGSEKRYPKDLTVAALKVCVLFTCPPPPLRNASRGASGHFVSVLITSTVNSFGSEKRYPKDLTVAALKGKLEMITGASSNLMTIDVYKDDKLVCNLDNNEALLGSYPIDDGMRLHVTDKSGGIAQFDDLSKVEKYEMAEDEYAKKTDSVRAFKERNQIGRFNPELQQKKEEAKRQREEAEKQAAEKIKVGDRCEVQVTGQPTKRGSVMYVGFTDFKPGYWVGVKYDEPLGKNDGSVQGKRYFECQDKYGAFVKPENVVVGDFPEEDFLDEDMEM